MKPTRPQLEAAARAMVEWVKWHAMMRAKVLRPYAVINGEVLDSLAVVYHDPAAMR